MKYFNGKKISSARFDGKRSGEVQFFKPGSLPDIGGQSPTPNLTTPPPRVGRDVFTIIPRGGCDGCVNTDEGRWWGWVEDSDPSQTGEILYLHLSQQPRPNEINSTEIYYTSFPVSGGNNLIGTAIDQVRIVDNGTETVYTASGLLNGINGEGLSANTALDLSTMSVGIRGIRAPDVNQNLVELIDFSFAWNSGAYLTMGGGISLLFRYIQENDASWRGGVGLGFDGYGELGAEFTPVITRQDLENAASDGKNSQAFKKVLFRPNITNDTACDLTPCVTEPPRTEDPITWWEPPRPTTTTTTTTTTTPAPCSSDADCPDVWFLETYSVYSDNTPICPSLTFDTEEEAMAVYEADIEEGTCGYMYPIQISQVCCEGECQSVPCSGRCYNCSWSTDEMQYDSQEEALSACNSALSNYNTSDLCPYQDCEASTGYGYDDGYWHWRIMFLTCSYEQRQDCPENYTFEKNVACPNPLP